MSRDELVSGDERTSPDAPVIVPISDAQHLKPVTALQAVKNFGKFWPFLLRSTMIAGSDIGKSYVVAQNSVEGLAAYAVYQSSIMLVCGLLYSSVFPVVTLISDAKAKEDEAGVDQEKIEKAREEIRLIWRQGLIFTLPLSALAVVFAMSAPPAFTLFKLPEVVLKNSQMFFVYAMLGFLADIIYRLTARLVSGLGVKKSIMFADGFDKTCELLLSYLFLNGKWGFPELGVAGIGLAYSISKILTLFLHLTYIYTSPACFGFDYQKYRLFACDGAFFDKTLFRKLASVAIPNALSTVLSNIAGMLVVMFCGQGGGTSALVGLQIASAFKSFSTLHMSTVYNSASAEIGKNLHIYENKEGKYSANTLVQAVKNTLNYARLLMFLCVTVALLNLGLAFSIPRQLVTLFLSESNGAQQTHLSTAITFLKMQSVIGVVGGSLSAVNCVLDALLDKKFILYTTILADLILNPAAAAVTHYGLRKGADWTYGAGSLGAGFMLLAFLWRCYSKLLGSNSLSSPQPLQHEEEQPRVPMLTRLRNYVWQTPSVEKPTSVLTEESGLLLSRG